MKDNYIKKFNKIGKCVDIVANILKVLTIVSMVLVVLLYIFLDMMDKGIMGFYAGDDLYFEIDLRDFGFIYSDVDRAEQQENADLKWYSYQFIEEEFAESHSKLKLELLEAYTCVTSHNDVEVTNVHIKGCDVFLVIAFVYQIFALISIVFAARLFKALRYEQSPFGFYVIKNMQRFAFSLVPWVIAGPMLSVESTVNYSKISVLAGVNLITLLIMAVLLLFVSIFKYGALLQKESDETL